MKHGRGQGCAGRSLGITYKYTHFLAPSLPRFRDQQEVQEQTIINSISTLERGTYISLFIMWSNSPFEERISQNSYPVSVEPVNKNKLQQVQSGAPLGFTSGRELPQQTMFPSQGSLYFPTTQILVSVPARLCCSHLSPSSLAIPHFPTSLHSCAIAPQIQVPVASGRCHYHCQPLSAHWVVGAPNWVEGTCDESAGFSLESERCHLQILEIFEWKHRMGGWLSRTVDQKWVCERTKRGLQMDQNSFPFLERYYHVKIKAIRWSELRRK